MRTDDGFELCVFEPPNLEDVQSTSKMYGIDAFVGKNLHMKQYKNFLKKTNEGHSFISVCSNEVSTFVVSTKQYCCSSLFPE